MPMSVHGVRKQVSRGGPGKSVFETDIDNTDKVESSDPRAPTAERWKYEGPWLGGMTEGEFREYVQKGISHRKTEFTAYVKQHIREKILSDRRREYRTEGRDWNDEVDGVVELSDLDFADHLKVLRGDTKLNSELSRLIRNFFDLPAMPAQDSKSFGEISVLQTQIESLIGNTDTGPPMTHPSAGLSYLRTASYLQNHPVLGPQKKQTPIQARVLQTRNSALGNNRQAKLGVAGVVAEDQAQAGGFRDDAAVTTLDPELEGGNKLWVHPLRAAINARGRIKLEVERAGKEAVAVHSGDLSTIPTPMAFSTPPRGGQRVNEPLPGAEPPYARYGYGLSRTPLGQRPAPQHRAQGLDSTAADEITRLMEEGMQRKRERDDADQ
ncbi:hypothetical protein B0A49_01604 [Cryomyces minteri]|uniref:Uncharacterized protein n=1 Tax=Cryomyces minteri TaxID=331657 RepID=A0A4U0XL79_9PEZI|nr:hypothetical protein B0A49_01604 [Cryomyces minteri]